MISSDNPKTFLVTMVFIISIMFVSRAESGENWTYCYNKSSNRIYFLETKELKKTKIHVMEKLIFRVIKIII